MDWQVSVIVPFYNAAPWVTRCVTSLRNQTLQGLEIVLVDDASDDDSPRLAREYALSCPAQVRYLRRPENQGPGEARNAGLAQARGVYVGFMDVDDTVEPDMYARLFAQAASQGAQVAVCGMRLVDKGHERLLLPPEHCTKKALLEDKHLLPSACNKLFLRKHLETGGIRFPKTSIGEDLAFCAKAIAGSQTLAFVNAPLYIYEKKAASLIHDIGKRLDILDSLADLKRYCRTHNIEMSWYRRLIYLHALYNPACHIVIDALLHGKNRSHTLRNTPAFCLGLCKRLLRGDI